MMSGVGGPKVPPNKLSVNSMSKTNSENIIPNNLKPTSIPPIESCVNKPTIEKQTPYIFLP